MSGRSIRNVLLSILGILGLLGVSAALLTGCAVERGDALENLFDKGLAALERDDRHGVESVIDELEADYPAEPLPHYFYGMLSLEDEGLAAAGLIFDRFYHETYERYVRGYQQLDFDDRRGATPTRRAAIRIANLYVEHSRLSEYTKFSFLINDMDAVVQHHR